jgi:hypothetical protein
MTEFILKNQPDHKWEMMLPELGKDSGGRSHPAFPRQRREQADRGFLASPDEFGCRWQSQSQMTATPNHAL